MRILINGWECDNRTPNKLLRDLIRILRVEVLPLQESINENPDSDKDILELVEIYYNER